MGIALNRLVPNFFFLLTIVLFRHQKFEIVLDILKVILDCSKILVNSGSKVCKFFLALFSLFLQGLDIQLQRLKLKTTSVTGLYDFCHAEPES